MSSERDRKNDYYELACCNLHSLYYLIESNFYNDIAVQTQQITEKMLKSIAERVCVDAESLLRTHNLRMLFDAIKLVIPTFDLDRGQLSILKDFYFEAKYPGDNFVLVSRKECEECLELMYDCIGEVNKVGKSLNLPIHVMKRKMLNPEQDDCPNLMNLFS